MIRETLPDRRGSREQTDAVWAISMRGRFKGWFGFGVGRGYGLVWVGTRVWAGVFRIKGIVALSVYGTFLFVRPVGPAVFYRICPFDGEL